MKNIYVITRDMLLINHIITSNRDSEPALYHACRNIKAYRKLKNAYPPDIVIMDYLENLREARWRDEIPKEIEIRSFFKNIQSSPESRKASRFIYGLSSIFTSLAEYIVYYGFKELYKLPIDATICLLFKILNKIIPGGLVLLDWFQARIGHQAYNTLAYIRKKEALGDKRKIISHTFLSANKQLEKMIERKYFIYNIKNRKIYEAINNNPFIRRSGMMDITQHYRDQDIPISLFDKGYLDLEFSKKELNIGYSELKRMGINKKFVCIHSRDSEYLKIEHKYRDEKSWAYHDFRNCSILSYLEAARWLVSQGYQVIRMGFHVKEEIPDIPENEGIIDYAVKYRSDFMDIFLVANCEFFLGCGCGLTQIATIFNKSIAAANWPGVEMITNLRKGDLYIPKMIYSKKADRCLSLLEMLITKASRFQKTEEFLKLGLEVIDNSSTEILNLCKEMEQKLKHKWKAEPEDEELLSSYRSIMNNPECLAAGIEAELPTLFMRNNQWFVIYAKEE